MGTHITVLELLVLGVLSLFVYGFVKTVYDMFFTKK